MDAEIAVVGAGPAGLSAAVAVGEAGCRVGLVDAYARPGGQYFKQLPGEFKAQAPQVLHHETSVAVDLFRRVERITSVDMLSGTGVWMAERRSGESPHTLHLAGPTGAFELRAEAVILAPGAYDRALPFPGWDVPGVMTVGAAQTLIKSQRVLPGHRIVLSGAGPFLLPVAVGLAEAGAHVVAVCEATPPLWSSPWTGIKMMNHPDKILEGVDYLKTLQKYRVPVKYGRAVTRVTGRDRVESATVSRIGKDWVPVPGGEEEVQVDTVCVGYGFMPSNELTHLFGCEHDYDPIGGAAFARHDDDMQSTEPGVFVAGEITGVRGSAVALAQGSISGLAAARSIGKVGQAEYEQAVGPLRKTYHHRRAFGDLLVRYFAVQQGWMSWVTPETIICRCEEVTFGEVTDAVTRHEARDVKTVKSITRCGMGPCQGRECAYAVTALTARLSGRSAAEVGTFTSQPIVRPIPLAEML